MRLLESKIVWALFLAMSLQALSAQTENIVNWIDQSVNDEKIITLEDNSSIKIK